MDKPDFRYVDQDGVEIEAYQLTKQTRWLNQRWPDWLNMQRSPSEMNAMFAKDGDINNLHLYSTHGEVRIPDYGWVVKLPDGTLQSRTAIEMEKAKKVVPEPPKVVHPPADGMPDESHLAKQYPQHITEGKTAEDYKHVTKSQPPKPTAENVSGDVTEMRNEMMTAIKFLREEGGVEAALDYLIDSVSKRTRWCSCAPSLCDGVETIGCRKKSPLIR